MPKLCYVERNFRPEALAIIAQANTIIAEYLAAGFRLTLRQIYYQFVSRDWLKNQQKEYKRLGSIINDARLAGLIDWSAIEDRGRNLLYSPSWNSPKEIIQTCASQYRIDPWKDQEYYIECWVEKEALIGVLAVPCEEWRVPHFACKGYTSQSEMWDAGHNRLKKKVRAGKKIVILHLGDHDPSGIDMTRDVQDRLWMFTGGEGEVVRLALNMDQVEQYNPPPNPAKMTDSRFNGYEAEYGDESWELDALSPTTISDLISVEIEDRVDADAWNDSMEREASERGTLEKISKRYNDICEFLSDTEVSE